MKKILAALLFFIPIAMEASGISYSVSFEGLQDPRTLKTIKSISQLMILRKREPPSINALRYRAESDVPEILKALHANGYYEATVKIEYTSSSINRVHVSFLISPGPLYKVEDYSFSLYCWTPEEPVLCSEITLDSMGVKLGAPAQAQNLLNAELRLLQLLGACGYPLAGVDKREIVADGSTHGIRSNLDVHTGPESHFGSIAISGEKDIKPLFIRQKMTWNEGDLYNSQLVEKMQNDLMDTGLFSSVLIRHGETLDDEGKLPMYVDISETKHRSVNIGISYQTFYGPGVTFGWENRNLDGLGRRLSLQGDLTKKAILGIATYFIPNFFRIGQDWIWQAQAVREDIFPYTQDSYSLISRVERKIGKHTRVSGGGRVERIIVTDSVDNGTFTLIEGPIYFRWSSANDLLNPTKGLTFEYRTVPSLNLHMDRDYFLYQEAMFSTYIALNKKRTALIAQKWTLGSILSNELNAIPVPKRLFGGTDTDLRGYRYRSVSPLGRHHKPIGGRSAIFYSIEARLRVSKTLGLVPFYDVGNVRETVLPTTSGKWFTSTGLGIRYFSFLGPLRFDIGFPLDRRKGIDPKYRILINIGQTF